MDPIKSYYRQCYTLVFWKQLPALLSAQNTTRSMYYTTGCTSRSSRDKSPNMIAEIKITCFIVFLSVLLALSTATSSSCKCTIEGGPKGARLLKCTSANRAPAYAYAVGLRTRNVDACIRSTWNKEINQAQGAFGLCSPCSTGAQANACVKYARDVIQEWCAAKYPKMDQPRCKCTATSRGVGKSTVSCTSTDGSVVKVNVNGLERNAKKLGDCFNRNIPLAAATLYCRPCLDTDRARSCANFINFTAKSLCYRRS